MWETEPDEDTPSIGGSDYSKHFTVDEQDMPSMTRGRRRVSKAVIESAATATTLGAGMTATKP